MLWPSGEVFTSAESGARRARGAPEGVAQARLAGGVLDEDRPGQWIQSRRPSQWGYPHSIRKDRFR